MFSPHFVNLVYVPLMNFLKLLIYFSKRSAKKTYFQKDMNELAAGEQIDIPKTYGSTLNIVFITLFYFTGMPVLVIFCLVHFFFTYVAEKYLIINHYSKSNYFIDEKIS